MHQKDPKASGTFEKDGPKASGTFEKDGPHFKSVNDLKNKSRMTLMMLSQGKPSSLNRTARQ